MKIVKLLIEILNTITNDSQNGVLKKCEEFGFDPNRGEITLSESFINLNQSRDIIKDAIEKNKLNQFPLTVQKIILQGFESIINFQSNLVSGTDQVVNLVNAIEQLYTDIWRFGVHNLSGEVLGYTTKMNQLKDEEVKIKQLRRELDNGLRLKDELEKLLEEIQKSSTDINGLLATSQTSNETIKRELDKAIDTAQKAVAHLTTIQQNDITASQLLSSSVANNSEIVTLEAKIREFFNTIDNYKKDIDTTAGQAKTNVAENKKQTDDIVKELKTLEDQIKD
jgi:chromosome segregation ATPase